MSLLSMLAPVAGDLQRVDALIRARLDSDVALVRQVAQYLVSAGGKRLRPALLLLASGALGYRGELVAVLAATLRDDRCLHRRTGDGGLTETDAFAFADHEHLIEDYFRAHVRRYLFYLEFFAGGNLVLLAAGFYDRVHE